MDREERKRDGKNGQKLPVCFTFPSLFAKLTRDMEREKMSYGKECHKKEKRTFSPQEEFSSEIRSGMFYHSSLIPRRIAFKWYVIHPFIPPHSLLFLVFSHSGLCPCYTASLSQIVRGRWWRVSFSFSPQIECIKRTFLSSSRLKSSESCCVHSGFPLNHFIPAMKDRNKWRDRVKEIISFGFFDQIDKEMGKNQDQR